MELLIAIAIIVGVYYAVTYFFWPLVYERPPYTLLWRRYFYLPLLLLLFVAFLIYGQSDPTPWIIALSLVGAWLLVFAVK
jgi:hypothetical protein